jgi:hypothetical protein
LSLIGADINGAKVTDSVTYSGFAYMVWDHAASATGTDEATAEKMQWLRATAGDRLNELELSVPVFTAEVTDHPQQTAERIAPRYGLTRKEVLESPQFLVGSVEGIVEELERRRETYGVSYVIFGRDTHEAMAPVVARLAGR